MSGRSVPSRVLLAARSLLWLALALSVAVWRMGAERIEEEQQDNVDDEQDENDRDGPNPLRTAGNVLGAILPLAGPGKALGHDTAENPGRSCLVFCLVLRANASCCRGGLFLFWTTRREEVMDGWMDGWMHPELS